MARLSSKKSNTARTPRRVKEIPKWKMWLYASALVIVVSAYFATFFAHAYRGLDFSYNLLELIRYIVQLGFPKVWFAALFIVCEVLITAAMFMRKSPGTPDELRDFSYSDSADYGTARLMTQEEAYNCDSLIVKDVYENIGDILGMFDDYGYETAAFNIKNNRVNRHKLVLGASSSGKTFSFVKPLLAQICVRRESVVMSDPKGELFEETSEYFRNFGYVIKCINFKDFAHSDCWNLMSELGPRDDAAGAQERARLFANTVISNTMPGTTGLYRDGPLSLLMAILLRVHLDTSMPDSFDEVVRIISNPAAIDFFDQLFDENVLQGDLKCCLGYYATFKSASANLSGNIFTGLATALNSFQIERVRMVMSHDGINLTLPGKKPCAYYFLFPDQNEDYKYLIALLFTFVFNDLVNYADAQPDRKCAVPVNILLEEAKSVGVIPLFATRLSNIRSRAIYITAIFQDLAQIQFLYPEDWQSILDNCSTHIGLGFNDLDTAKLFSDRSGAATIVASTEKHQGVESQMTSMFAPTSEGSGSRTVYTTDELLRMHRDECVVALQYHNLLQLHKFPITLHPDFKLMDAKYVKPADVIPNIADEEAREEYYAKCDKQVADYEAWLAAGNNPIHGKRSDQKDDESGSVMNEAFRKAREAFNRFNEVVLDRDAANARKPKKNKTGTTVDEAWFIPKLASGANAETQEQSKRADTQSDDDDDFESLFEEFEDNTSWFDDFDDENTTVDAEINEDKKETAAHTDNQSKSTKQTATSKTKNTNTTNNTQHTSKSAKSQNTKQVPQPDKQNAQSNKQKSGMSSPKRDARPGQKKRNSGATNNSPKPSEFTKNSLDTDSES